MCVDIDAIESFAWLLLDVAEYLRQPPSPSPADKTIRTALRARIMRELRRHERTGDPLVLSEKIRELMIGADLNQESIVRK